jgi:hypothetical protein
VVIYAKVVDFIQQCLNVIKIKFHIVLNHRGTLLVAQLVETLRYKSEGRGFDSQWCYWNFSLT